MDKGRIGLTVYSPDCTQSRLWGNLDHFIQAQTDAQIVHRQWIYHDYNTIMAFYNEDGADIPYRDPDEAKQGYDNIAPQDLKYGHLTAKLFMSGASLLTLWQGDTIIERLLPIKGATHPSEADTNSVRGGFWCDNGVCNLMHSSDNPDEARRELEAINCATVLEQEPTPQSGFQTISNPVDYVPHSAIVILYQLVNRLLMVRGEGGIQIQLDSSGNAKAIYEMLSTQLDTVVTRTDHDEIIRVVQAYRAGNLVDLDAMRPTLPLTSWEAFVLQCGAITIEKWKQSTWVAILVML